MSRSADTVASLVEEAREQGRREELEAVVEFLDDYAAKLDSTELGPKRDEKGAALLRKVASHTRRRQRFGMAKEDE